MTHTLDHENIINLDGFKDLSTKNLLEGIENSKTASFERVLFALGIRYVGKTVAENLAAYFKNIDNLAAATHEELVEAPEIGEQIANSIRLFFQDPDNQQLVDQLKETGLAFELKQEAVNLMTGHLLGKSFVVSGIFKSFGREEIKDCGFFRNNNKNLFS